MTGCIFWGVTHSIETETNETNAVHISIDDTCRILRERDDE